MYLAACDVAFTVSNQTVLCPGDLSLIDVSTLFTTFDVSLLNPSVLMGAFGAGFVIVGTIHVAGFALGIVLKAVQGKFH